MGGRMNGGDSSDDKNFEPTESRLAKARREGDVAQSREANAAGAYVGLYGAFLATSVTAAMTAAPLSALLSLPEDYGASLLFAGGDTAAALILAVGVASSAYLLLPGLGALLSLIAQRSLVFAPSKLSAKFSRISPVENAKQKYGPEGLAEFAKGAVKLLFIMSAFSWLFAHGLERWPAYARAASGATPELMMRESAVFVGLICLFSILVAAIDLPWQRMRHRKKLMMSFEELKRETKESDGDPAMKQSRRQRAKAIAANRMLLDVPTATVLIVNPTHYAVALKWDGPKSGAPVCVAKGVDEMAAKIREIAARAGVPVRSDPPTARAIFASVEVGEEVRRDHYAAVAASIVFAEKARSARKFS